MQYKNTKTKVLVSYLGKWQVISLQENDTMGQMTGLKQQVSSYFGIPSGTKVILQRFDKEWDTYLDLDEGYAFQDHDKLQVTITSERIPAKEKSDSGSKSQLVNTELMVCTYIFFTVNYKCYLYIPYIAI